MIRFIVLWVLFLWGSSCSIWAHQPNEISYFLKWEEQQLIIHLTPKSAIDLLEYIDPQLKEKNHFLLGAYHHVFQDYFRTHSSCIVDGIPLDFQLMESNLNKHDATLTFRWTKLQGPPKSITMVLNGFQEVYKRVRTHVFIDDGKQKYHYNLTKNQKECIHYFKTRSESYTIWPNMILLGNLLIGLLIAGFVIHRKKQQSIKPLAP
ncbi:MAG: hypothetical protein AAGF77_11865 [Bacteroidota bacterium]